MLQSPDAGRGLVLIYLADNGKVVKEGEIVARIDAQSVIDHLEDVESSITQAALDIRRRKAEYSAQTEYLQQRVRAAKGELEKAIQDARVASLKPEITQELLRLAVSEAEALYQELRTELPLTDQRQMPTCGSTKWRTKPRSATAIATGRMRTTAKSSRPWTAWWSCRPGIGTASKTRSNSATSWPRGSRSCASWSRAACCWTPR